MTVWPRDGSILEPLALARLSLGRVGILGSAVDYTAEAMIGAHEVAVRRVVRWRWNNGSLKLDVRRVKWRFGLK